jgi:hypothetical protein
MAIQFYESRAAGGVQMTDGRGTAETRFSDPAALLPNNATAWSYIVMAKGKLVV